MPKLLFDRGPEHQPVRWTGARGDGGRFMKRAATILAIGALGAPLATGLAALSGLDHRWPDILAQFPAPALAVTVVFAIVLLVLRLRVAFVAALTVTAILVTAIWPQAMADRGTPRPGAPVVTLYSANLYYLNTDAAKVRASIAAANPDIVVLIETSPAIVGQLDTVLAGYPNRSITGDPSRGANVIAARFPLTPSRLHAVATIDVPFGALNVVAIHMTRPWPFQIQWEQIRHANVLGKFLTYLHGPAVVAGDFNSVSSGRIGRQIQDETGMKANPGWPGTWPAQAPAIFGFTIDQVYRTPDLAVVSRKIGQRTGSDHRPVITRLTLAEPEPKP